LRIGCDGTGTRRMVDGSWRLWESNLPQHEMHDANVIWDPHTTCVKVLTLGEYVVRLIY
jgi:hypothetical protein